MFKKILAQVVLIGVFVVSLIPSMAVGQETVADYLFKSDYFPGEIVIVTGKGFGPYNNGSWICYYSTDYCLTYGSDYIISWTDTEIKFYMTLGIETPKSGHFTLYKDYDTKIADYAFNIDQKFFNDEWLYLQLYLKLIHFDEAYEKLTSTTPVTVAVIDDGVYLNHQDLIDTTWKNKGEVAGDLIDNDSNGYIDDVFGYNFVRDDNSMNVEGDHGTAVAGIIAAKRNNDIGMAGLAQNVKIMPIIVCDDQGCDQEDISEGIKYAVDNGAKLINLSLSSGSTNGYQIFFDDAFKYAYDRNVLIVTAAGNGDTENSKGIDLNTIPQSPVCNDVYGGNTVLGVGSSTVDGYLAYWSNYGNNCVDIYAPGELMLSLKATGDTYDFPMEGTSFSAPIITGLAANVLSRYPNMRNYTLINYFIENSNNNGAIVNAEDLYRDIKLTYEDEGPFIMSDNTINGQKSASNIIATLSTKNYFSDVSSSQLNVVAINFLKELGTLEGYSDGTFRPTQEINRAEMLKILIKGGLGVEPGVEHKKDCFIDVKSNDWFAPYVCYAKEKEWIDGYSDGTFKPAQFINKAEAIKMLVTVNNVPASANQVLPYLDVEDAWYTKYVKAVYALNLIEETGNMLGISKNVTRAQISENIYRLVLVNSTGASVYSSDLIEQVY